MIVRGMHQLVFVEQIRVIYQEGVTYDTNTILTFAGITVKYLTEPKVC